MPKRDRPRLVATVSPEAVDALDDIARKRFGGNRSMAVDWTAKIGAQILADRRTVDAVEADQALEDYVRHQKMSLKGQAWFFEEMVKLLVEGWSVEDVVELKQRAAAKVVSRVQNAAENGPSEEDRHFFERHFGIPVTPAEQEVLEKRGEMRTLVDMEKALRDGEFMRDKWGFLTPYTATE